MFAWLNRLFNKHHSIKTAWKVDPRFAERPSYLPKVRELKIKIKTLIEEAKIIRLEERKCIASFKQTNHAKLLDVFNRLHEHRVLTVRNEARYSFLVYAFIRGRKLSQTESKCDVEKLDIVKLVSMFERFGNLSRLEAHNKLESWLKD